MLSHKEMNRQKNIIYLKKAVDKYLLKPGFFVLALFIALSTEAKAQASSDSSTVNITWTTEKLDEGIYWKSYRGDELFDARQSINLVEVFLDSVTAEFKVAFLEDSMIKTSEFGEENNALAAVNGSFFRRDTGGSAVFLKVNGDIIYEGQPHRNQYHESGAVAWSANKPIQILKKPEQGWRSSDFETIMSSGPLLIYESDIQNFNNDPFHQNRHPRTAVALTNDERLYLVTIDGRSFQAYGMTIPELSEFLLELGAENALNLDGGGSTAMWIRNATENGIVNYPSDNLEFDHEGERRVANALLIVPSN